MTLRCIIDNCQFKTEDIEILHLHLEGDHWFDAHAALAQLIAQTIPISKLKALIKELEDAERIDDFNYYSWNAVQDVILTMKELLPKED